MLNETQLCVNRLNNYWTLWIHLPHDTNWAIDSYKNICCFEYLEQASAVLNYIQENLVVNCMLFIMREDIKPIWEDERNKDGSCISYKINNRLVNNIWRQMSLFMVSENLLEGETIQQSINGITVSPKKNFCIVKIWFNGSIDDKTVIQVNKGIPELGNFEAILSVTFNGK